MIKRKEQSQFAGEVFSGIADSLVTNGRVQPFAIVIGLLAAFERMAKAFIETGAAQHGAEGKAIAIHAIRAGLQSILHTIDTIERNETPEPYIPPSPPNPHIN